jgi:hypothetical protein
MVWSVSTDQDAGQNSSAITSGFEPSELFAVNVLPSARRKAGGGES